MRYAVEEPTDDVPERVLCLFDDGIEVNRIVIDADADVDEWGAHMIAIQPVEPWQRSS